MPSISVFLNALFGAGGAFRYLGDFLDGSAGYRLVANVVDAQGPADKSVRARAQQVVHTDARYRLTAVAVHHGPIPTVAWRVQTGSRTLVFSGDMNNRYQTLASLATRADLLVAHHAVPEQAGRVALSLHMPPSEIGQIAAKADVKQLVLSHRMTRTLGLESESTGAIRRAYKGPLHFAEDLQCFRP